MASVRTASHPKGHGRTTVAVAQTGFLVVAPGHHAALHEHALVELLPSFAVVLDDWLIWYAEGGSHNGRPEGGFVEELGLVEGFTGGGEGEERVRVKVWKDEEEDLDW
jgi:hypothetical protein